MVVLMVGWPPAGRRAHRGRTPSWRSHSYSCAGPRAAQGTRSCGLRRAARLTNRYGRRGILLWVAALFSATSIATGMAPSFSTFVLARFIGGLAVGGASILSPMYVAEVSPPSLRGRMGTLYQLSIVVGILMSYCINYLLRNRMPTTMEN